MKSQVCQQNRLRCSSPVQRLKEQIVHNLQIACKEMIHWKLEPRAPTSMPKHPQQDPPFIRKHFQQNGDESDLWCKNEVVSHIEKDKRGASNACVHPLSGKVNDNERDHEQKSATQEKDNDEAEESRVVGNVFVQVAAADVSGPWRWVALR